MPLSTAISFSFSNIVATGNASPLSPTALVERPSEVLRLQIPIDQVDLLKSSQAFTDLLGTHLPYPVDRLQLTRRRGEHVVKPFEFAHDVLHDHLRQARHAPQYPVAARRDRKVERVELAVVAHQLGQAPEVE